MKNSAIILKFYFPVSLLAVAITVTGYLFHTTFSDSNLILDISGLGLLIGVLGTVYTLVSAFVVAEVWSQFNSMGEMLSQEAKAISSLWNFTNYFNSASLTKSMREALLRYTSKVVNNEISDASKLVRSIHPSNELNEIHNIIDSTKFDDSRDSSIYPSFISAFEELSAIRAKRIDASVSRVPLFLKSLMGLLSTLLVISFFLLGFNNLLLYSFALFGVTLVTLVIFGVINDLDNPFDGVWNLDMTMLNHSIKYIEKSKQKVG